MQADVGPGGGGDPSPGTVPGRRPAILTRFRRGFASLPPAWRRAIVAVLVLRLAVSFLSFAFGGLLRGLDPVSVEANAAAGFEGWPARTTEDQGYGLLGAGVERFDALWYLSIARDGYPAAAPGDVPAAAAFFPGFPLVVGILGRVLLGHYLLAASVVAAVAAVAALAGIHRLVEEETGDEVLAGRALVTVAVFPSAFFLVAPYTEGLFLALVAWTFVWARRGAWSRVALLAAAAALTRSLGVLLVVPIFVELYRHRRHGPAPGPLPAAGALAGAPAGLAAFLAFSWWRFGDLLAPVHAQLDWERAWTSPLTSLADAWEFATATPGLYPSGYHSIDLLIGVPVLAATVWLLARAPLAYGLFAVANVAVWLVYPFPGRPLMSTYRFALAVAPLFWAFGAWTRRRGVATVWWASSSALQGVILLLFVNWYYVF